MGGDGGDGGGGGEKQGERLPLIGKVMNVDEDKRWWKWMWECVVRGSDGEDVCVCVCVYVCVCVCVCVRTMVLVWCLS